MNKIFPVVFLLAFLLNACSSCSNKNKEKEFLPVIERKKMTDIYVPPIKIHRYEQDLFAIPLDSLKEKLTTLHKKYSFFYKLEDLNNPANIYQMKLYLTDPVVKQFKKDVDKQYNDLSWLENSLKEAFKRILYFDSSFVIPNIYTYVSGGDFEFPVKYAENNLIIALDMYLGENYNIYKQFGIPKYISYRMTKDFIIVDCMKEIGRSYVEKYNPPNSTLLDKMLYHGKILYFTDLALPEIPDSIKIYYTTPQYMWASTNEGNVWGFFIDKKLLYTTDVREINKYIGEAPFTSTFSQNSAPRIGQYIGWQIIRSYARSHPNENFKNIFSITNSSILLQQSGYKPKKN